MGMRGRAPFHHLCGYSFCRCLLGIFCFCLHSANSTFLCIACCRSLILCCVRLCACLCACDVVRAHTWIWQYCGSVFLSMFWCWLWNAVFLKIFLTLGVCAPLSTKSVGHTNGIMYRPTIVDTMTGPTTLNI